MPRAAVVVRSLLLPLSLSLSLLGNANARPAAQVSEANLPLRAVAKTAGVRLANCVFSLRSIPPHARATTPLTDGFSAGDPMYARCYLPDRPGSNRAGDLTDVFFLDGKKWWTQTYDEAVPADALERPIALSEVLRTALANIPKGAHRIEVEGTLTHGRHVTRLYRSSFRYVR